MNSILKYFRFAVYPLVVCLIAAQVPVSAFAQGSDQVTITTYYPSPLGVYRQLQLRTDNLFSALNLKRYPYNDAVPQAGVKSVGMNFRLGTTLASLTEYARIYGIIIGDYSTWYPFPPPGGLAFYTRSAGGSAATEKVRMETYSQVSSGTYSSRIVLNSSASGDPSGVDGGAGARISLSPDNNHLLGVNKSAPVEMWFTSPNKISYYDNSYTERVTFDLAQGRFGINNPAPRAALDVNGGIVATGNLRLPNWIFSKSNPYFSINGSQNVLKINGSTGSVYQPNGDYRIESGQLYMDNPVQWGLFCAAIGGTIAVEVAIVVTAITVFCLLFPYVCSVLSSQRFKKDIKVLDNPLEKVKKLRGVEFTWKKSNKPDIGLIAEEVGKVYPQLLTYEADGKTVKSFNHFGLIGVLAEAAKEQLKEIDSQDREIAVLKQELADFKQLIKK